MIATRKFALVLAALLITAMTGTAMAAGTEQTTQPARAKMSSPHR